MDENKLKAIVEEVVNKAVEPITQRLDGVESKLGGLEGRLGGIEARLDDPDTGFKRLNDRVDANTAAVVKLESTINGYGDMYKINDSNIRKMEKRLETVEEDAGIEVPPELHLEPVSQAA